MVPGMLPEPYWDLNMVQEQFNYAQMKKYLNRACKTVLKPYEAQQLTKALNADKELVFHIDMSQYTPGPNGQSPKSGSAGAVKEAMYDIANEPMMFFAVFPAVALGAPLAEEVIFRGQLFSALSSTRLGVAGTTVVTAALWALLHVTEPWLSIGLIFVMGLVFGWLMYRFGSIWVTIVCHGVWNGVYALLIFANLGGGA